MYVCMRVCVRERVERNTHDIGNTIHVHYIDTSNDLCCVENIDGIAVEIYQKKIVIYLKEITMIRERTIKRILLLTCLRSCRRAYIIYTIASKG